VIGLVGDDDRRPADHDQQPQAGLNLIPNVAQQHCSCHPGHGGGDGEHDEAPVDEREHGCDQPDRRRRGEGEAAAREQRQNDRRGCRNGEPERRAWRIRRVAPEGDLERGLDRGGHDQGVECVPAHEGSEPSHAVNVLQPPRLRLLPE